MSSRTLWLRWFVMNGVAEFIGLTSTMALAAGSFAAETDSLAIGLALALGVAGLGAVVEGVVVGGAQWWAMRPAVPEMPARDWVIATALGAFVAWSLGMLPSTIISAASAASAASPGPSATPSEPALWLQLVLAIGMGAVLGPFLGVPQWRVLRRYVPRSGSWVAANVVAWALGMPMIFLATSFIGSADPVWKIASIVALGCLVAGLVVGAVHGWWLVRLLSRDGRLART